MTSKHEQTRAHDRVLDQVAAEMRRQDKRWGEQNHPNGTGPALRPLRGIASERALVSLEPIDGTSAEVLAAAARAWCQRRAQIGDVTWADIFREEVFESLAEFESPMLREELLQVAAVCTQWVIAIDRATR